jgi:hypothetical protein
MLKVAYGRPDTWHWLFFARLLTAQPALVAEQFIVSVDWELTVGIGRSMIQMPRFERYTFAWGPSSTPPFLAVYSSSVYALNRLAGEVHDAPPQVSTNFIAEIVAQDIQLVAHVRYETNAAAPLPIDIELSAQVAPKNHIRPDWYRIAPEEAVFGGAELDGR